MAKIQVGDRVAYRASFVKFCGSHDKEMADARAKVISVKDYGAVSVANVEWEKGADFPEKVAVQNLAKVGSPAFASNEL